MKILASCEKDNPSLWRLRVSMTSYRSGLEIASRMRLASWRSSSGLSIVFMSCVPTVLDAIDAYKITFPILRLPGRN